MKNSVTYSKGKRIISLIFLSLLLCVQISLAGDGDKGKKGKFDLNDPRNPDCPCHKYQKIADEEYFKLLKQEKRVDLNTGTVLNTGGGGSGEINKRRHSGGIKLFKHHRNQRLFFMNKGHGRCKKRRHHFNGDISSCFRW